MLVLTRGEGETIFIGENITVTVLEIRGGKVRLGIEAPSDVPIQRQELITGARPSQQPGHTRREERRALIREARPPISEPLLPPTQEIAAIAREEVHAAGGGVSECVENERDLFFRAVLPITGEVGPGDLVRSGIALRTAAKVIVVSQYTLRQVCRNGRIASDTEDAGRIRRVGFAAPAEAIAAVIAELRDSLRRCCLGESFSTEVQKMESAAETDATGALEMLPRLYHVPQRRLTAIHTEVAKRFRRDGDGTLFGLMNAVTSVARDEADPHIRWQLEELGGAIPSLVFPRAKPGGAQANEPVGTVV